MGIEVTDQKEYNSALTKLAAEKEIMARAYDRYIQDLKGQIAALKGAPGKPQKLTKTFETTWSIQKNMWDQDVILPDDIAFLDLYAFTSSPTKVTIELL
jgi:hypothetical protein